MTLLFFPLAATSMCSLIDFSSHQVFTFMLYFMHVKFYKLYKCGDDGGLGYLQGEK